MFTKTESQFFKVLEMITETEGEITDITFQEWKDGNQSGAPTRYGKNIQTAPKVYVFISAALSPYGVVVKSPMLSWATDEERDEIYAALQKAGGKTND